MPDDLSPNQLNQTVHGSFDQYSLETILMYNSDHLDAPLNFHSFDNVVAKATEIHEWSHFMQFSSTSYGLLLSMDRVHQLSAFLRTCFNLAKLKARNEKALILYVPFSKSIESDYYTNEEKKLIESFLRLWSSIQKNIKSKFGFWFNEEGNYSYQTTSPLNPHLPSEQFKNQPINIGHVVEPIANGCTIHWLLDAIGDESAMDVFEKINPIGPMYSLLPQIETTLNITRHTRMILHDYSLMLPIEKHDGRNTADPSIYSPTTRLIHALKLIAAGIIEQEYLSYRYNYHRLTKRLSEELNWPDPEENLKSAIKAASLYKALYQGTPFESIFNDFERAFKVRYENPDAFCSISIHAIELYNNGWQPVWRTPNGWIFRDSQSPSEAFNRLLAVLVSRACQSFSEGIPWNCPLSERCDLVEELSDLFPFSRDSNSDCHCRQALKFAVGNKFSPEQIEIVR